jgi:hypothetical protein
MYEWLKTHTTTGHISSLTGEELVRLEVKLKRIIKTQQNG